LFYDTETNDHGLPRDPFKSCIAPRPIGWISTLSADGIPNAAPYSFFNGVATEPPMVMYASNAQKGRGDKDTLENIRQTGEFVVNVCTWDTRDAMNETGRSHPPEADEFAAAGLTPQESNLIKAPRIGESPINMECKLERTVELPSAIPGEANVMVVGHVLGIHIADGILTDGLVDMDKLQLISRLGYMDYARVGAPFTMNRPG